MSHIHFDLEHNRERLGYFEGLRNSALAKLQAAGSRAKTTRYDTWVEIYTERVSKLERQVTKLGLKTQLNKAPSAQQRA